MTECVHDGDRQRRRNGHLALHLRNNGMDERLEAVAPVEPSHVVYSESTKLLERRVAQKILGALGHGDHRSQLCPWGSTLVGSGWSEVGGTTGGQWVGGWQVVVSWSCVVGGGGRW